MASSDTNADVFDVAIVGYGPVGAALAILLGQRGRRVVVLERQLEPYPMPRAVHYDHEVARILQACGVADECSEISEPAEIYEFQNADRRPLMRLGRIGNGPSGWPQSSMFSQPELEEILHRRVDELDQIEVRRGVKVTRFDDDGAAVTLHCERMERDTTAGDRRLRSAGSCRPITARYVVGCDGANSTLREQLGVAMIDRAYFYDWLIVDVIFDDQPNFEPANAQICDPARPTTVVSGGPGRRRWEFMGLPGETIDDLNDEATAWRLLEPWGARPDNARLERHAVYRFQARWADEWRRGRVLLAGDAAHQTPPFAGQGMCTGLRDSINLAWKLDLVLGDLAPDVLLDTYGSERGPHTQAVIELAIEMGKLICVADPAEAAARDEMFFALYDGSISDIPPFPPIGQGIVAAETAAAGELFLQAEVERDGVRARFDDIVGAGWRLVTMQESPLEPGLQEWFETIGGRVVPVGPGAIVDDLTGAYSKWFAEHGVVAALQRPDFVLAGTASDVHDVDRLLRNVRQLLTTAPAIIDSTPDIAF
jgi:2-polyprenyl-6-methoxyphenol hydroxylase-like FAD-dependent oxidoreductase